MTGYEAGNTGKCVMPAKEKVVSNTKGKWMYSTTTRGQLDHLSNVLFLLLPKVAFACSHVTMINNDDVWAEVFPQPEPNEWICFIPILTCGFDFPGSAAFLLSTTQSSPQLHLAQRVFHHAV